MKPWHQAANPSTIPCIMLADINLPGSLGPYHPAPGQAEPPSSCRTPRLPPGCCRPEHSSGQHGRNTRKSPTLCNERPRTKGRAVSSLLWVRGAGRILAFVTPRDWQDSCDSSRLAGLLWLMGLGGSCVRPPSWLLSLHSEVWAFQIYQRETIPKIFIHKTHTVLNSLHSMTDLGSDVKVRERGIYFRMHTWIWIGTV